MQTDKDMNITLKVGRREKSGSGWKIIFGLRDVGYPLGVPPGQKVLVTIGKESK